MRLCDRLGHLNDGEETENSTTDNESNYSLIIAEETLTSKLGNLGLQPPTGNLINAYSESKSSLKCMEYISMSGIFIQLQKDAKPDDLMRLLKKWCLEGPYETNDTIFVCYSRDKAVCIENTINFEPKVWKQLAMIMKYALKENEEDARLISLSPMFRYYGDLYPDNGRDEESI